MSEMFLNPAKSTHDIFLPQREQPIVFARIALKRRPNHQRKDVEEHNWETDQQHCQDSEPENPNSFCNELDFKHEGKDKRVSSLDSKENHQSHQIDQQMIILEEIQQS